MPLLPVNPPVGPDKAEMEQLAGDLVTRAAGMILCLQAAGFQVREDPLDLLAITLLGPTLALAVGGNPREGMEQAVMIAESLNIDQVRKLLEY